LPAGARLAVTVTLDEQLASRPARPVANPVRLRALATIQVTAAILAFVAVAATTQLQPEIGLGSSGVPFPLSVPASRAAHAAALRDPG
jgi:hypothetical protein